MFQEDDARCPKCAYGENKKKSGREREERYYEEIEEGVNVMRSKDVINRRRLVAFPSHANHCPATRRTGQTKRHDTIVRCLAKIAANLAGMLVEVEPGKIYTLAGAHNVAPDLLVFTADTLFCVDVTITDPTTMTNVCTYKSDKNLLVSAAKRAEGKIKKYKGVIETLEREGHPLTNGRKVVMVPFALETLGGMDEKAEGFLEMLADKAQLYNMYEATDKEQFVKRAKMLIAVKMAEANAECCMRTTYCMATGNINKKILNKWFGAKAGPLNARGQNRDRVPLDRQLDR